MTALEQAFHPEYNQRQELATIQWADLVGMEYPEHLSGINPEFDRWALGIQEETIFAINPKHAEDKPAGILVVVTGKSGSGKGSTVTHLQEWLTRQNKKIQDTLESTNRRRIAEGQEKIRVETANLTFADMMKAATLKNLIENPFQTENNRYTLRRLTNEELDLVSSHGSNLIVEYFKQDPDNTVKVAFLEVPAPPIKRHGKRVIIKKNRGMTTPLLVSVASTATIFSAAIIGEGVPNLARRHREWLAGENNGYDPHTEHHLIVRRLENGETTDPLTILQAKMGLYAPPDTMRAINEEYDSAVAMFSRRQHPLDKERAYAEAVLNMWRQDSWRAPHRKTTIVLENPPMNSAISEHLDVILQERLIKKLGLIT